MNLSHALTRTAPVLALGATLAVTMTAPAEADSGWWFSSNSGASGYFKAYGDKTTACDIATDGYLALVQIASINNSLLYQVADTRNDGRCTSRDASYFNLQEGATYKIRVCVVRTGIRPQNCSVLHEFTA
ncbi:hypothetical protein [Streptomyces sp. NPDC127038]|uniref:hypothetical protein n=1 Tax=Streptomyces sp. NPDC127038 TaxID=3347114 RepID=UPI003648D853